MFAAYLTYQLVDLLLAAASVLLVRRRVRRGPGATPFRQLLCAVVPVHAAVLLAVILLCRFVLQRAVVAAVQPWYGRYLAVGFLGVGIAWYAWLVCLPVLGALLAWRPGARSRRDRTLAAAWLLGSAALFGYCTFVEPFRVVVERVEVPLAEWPADVPPLRVLVLADLQTPAFTRREARVVELVEELKPDLVLIPGDLVGQSFDDAAARVAARAVIEQLHPPRGAFAVRGDVDDLVDGSIEAVTAGTTVTLLDNESAVVVAGVPLEVVGLDPHREAGSGRLLGQPARAALRIGLVHQPDHADALAAAGCDLVVAGHTHGGQVVVPGFGPPLTNSKVPRAVAAGGLHRLGAAWLYVSRGIGLEAGVAPPIRFLCPPEVTLLTLGPPAGAAGEGFPTLGK